jgi:hypothetical protein
LLQGVFPIICFLLGPAGEAGCNAIFMVCFNLSKTYDLPALGSLSIGVAFDVISCWEIDLRGI